MTHLFHLGDILSITTDRLVSLRHMEGVYDILNYMTGESLFTHQLIRAGEVCKPAILLQHPRLKNVSVADLDKDTWKDWLARQAEVHGKELSITPIGEGVYEAKDPIEELRDMKPDANIIIINTEGGTP